MAGSLRVFLDSNVLLSALFSDRGAPRRILDLLAARLPPIQPLVGAFNLLEIERNLGKRLPGAWPAARNLIDRLGFEIVPLPDPDAVTVWAQLIRAKDAPVIASAVAAEASVLVTGDKRDLLILKVPQLPFQILPPAEFLDSFLPRFLAALG